MKYIGCVIAIGLAMSSVAWGIGRSGNGRITDAIEGFSVIAPHKLSHAIPLTDRRLWLNEPKFSPTGIAIAPMSVEIRPFSNEYPEFSASRRSKVREAFLAEGWFKSEVANLECVEGFTAESETAVMAAITWGAGRGFVVIGYPKSSETRKSIASMLGSLQLDKGVCNWN